MATKICPKCQQEKPAEQFYKRKSSKDGLHPHCKDCCNQYEVERYRNDSEWRERRKTQAKRYYQASPEIRVARLEYVRKYNQTAKGKTVHETATKKWQQLNQQKRKAHQAVQTAVRNGTLPHPSTVRCQYPNCDKIANQYHHHNGYDETHWLDVIAICTKHHGLIHRKDSKNANQN